ncbi:hypothetical protein KVP10_14870 [Candidimonas humi]|uniref:Uncharacterized protein n=1 Tax=Candidimonas humi TaxID=683355 RepID=A0ABV8P2P6_9BURK|nr:hypothetical protein [Candidimonas humi]MBV6306174.1 hypothetical protein [Candidimonas humi]
MRHGIADPVSRLQVQTLQDNTAGHGMAFLSMDRRKECECAAYAQAAAELQCLRLRDGPA